MAQLLNFSCDNCARSFEAWDDGNPFFLNSKGQKIYAYHPNKLRDRCTGNDPTEICMNCGFVLNPAKNSQTQVCPDCKGVIFRDILSLDGVVCPFCKDGVFRVSGTDTIS
jgi:predicted RNA-binding Zn-ribbon protein involved in translation (DUF1610 family)